MANFGETLKRERELREISLREISDATKINIRYLEALEQNRFDVLPGGLFNKGFIRAYSTFVGIDGETMVNNYLQEALARQGGSAPAKGGQSAGVHRPTEVPRRRAAQNQGASTSIAGVSITLAAVPAIHAPDESRAPSRALFRIASLVVAAGAMFAVGLLIVRTMPRAHHAPATVVHPEPAGASISVSGPAAGSAADAGPTSAGEVPESAPTTEIASVGGLTMPPPQPKAEPSGPTLPPRPKPLARTVAPSSMELQVVATGPCQVRIACDDVESASRVMQPGESVALHCDRIVVLSSSDAGALRLTMNGAPCPAMGDPGSRVDRYTLRIDDYSQICPRLGAGGDARP